MSDAVNGLLFQDAIQGICGLYGIASKLYALKRQYGVEELANASVLVNGSGGQAQTACGLPCSAFSVLGLSIVWRIVWLVAY